MFSSSFEKIIDLAKRTGDKMIVMPEFGEPFAIVPIEQYERMMEDKADYAGMTEEEILNRVNREISLWKQAQREIGLGSDVDFFSPRDLGEDLMPRLPFDEPELPWLKEDKDKDSEEDIFGKKTFDPLADDDDDEDENLSAGEAGWTPPKWPQDFMDESVKPEDFKVEEIKDNKKEDNWKNDTSIFPAEDEPLDDEWLDEEVVGNVSYETEKTTEANKNINNKDLPIIDVDAERDEDEMKKKDEADEFLVEPIE
jgi:hypothetical protein